MDNPYALEKLKAKLDWCKQYMRAFIENEGFDPYAALAGTETKSQILYGACVEFTVEIAQLINNKCEEFDKQIDKIVFGRCKA